MQTLTASERQVVDAAAHGDLKWSDAAAAIAFGRKRAEAVWDAVRAASTGRPTGRETEVAA